MGTLGRTAEVERRLVERTRTFLVRRRAELGIGDVDHAALLAVQLLQSVARNPTVHTMGPEARAALARETRSLLRRYLLPDAAR